MGRRRDKQFDSFKKDVHAVRQAMAADEELAQEARRRVAATLTVDANREQHLQAAAEALWTCLDGLRGGEVVELLVRELAYAVCYLTSKFPKHTHPATADRAVLLLLEEVVGKLADYVEDLRAQPPDDDEAPPQGGMPS